VGLFGRNLEDLLRIANETLDVPREAKRLPTRILYPVDFFPLPNSVHQDLMDNFVSVLERHLNVKRTEISLASEWDKTAHQHQGLREYMVEVQYCETLNMSTAMYWLSLTALRPPSGHYVTTIITSTTTSGPFIRRHLTGDPSSNNHRYSDGKCELLAGENPCSGPLLSFARHVGSAVIEDEYEDYLERIDVFRRWFNENVMEIGQDSGFDTVMVLPYGIAEPKYRDAIPG